jgi:hypothetical protein
MRAISSTRLRPSGRPKSQWTKTDRTLGIRTPIYSPNLSVISEFLAKQEVFA